MSVDPRRVAAYLHQRRQLGELELFLEELTREQVLALLRGAPAAPAARGAARVREALAASAGPEPVRAAEAGEAPSSAAAALRVLAQEATGCPKCRLSETRTQVVFGDGTVQAEVVVVGEAPGADEDRTGVPFVGRAGRMLDLMLQAVGLPRERVYICNVLKCRPPSNRDPQPDEVAACTPYLERQIEIIEPRVLLAVGRFAAQFLAGSDAPLGRLRGTVHSYRGVPVVATYHPAYLLRSPSQVRRAWDDLQLLRRVVDGG